MGTPDRPPLEITVGLAGQAGDGLDKTGYNLANVASRSGHHVYAYNSYQSLIRGGHTWLRLRISERKVYTQGDQVNAVIALNQDLFEKAGLPLLDETADTSTILEVAQKLTVDSAGRSADAPERAGVAVLPWCPRRRRLGPPDADPFRTQ